MIIRSLIMGAAIGTICALIRWNKHYRKQIEEFINLIRAQTAELYSLYQANAKLQEEVQKLSGVSMQNDEEEK